MHRLVIAALAAAAFGFPSPARSASDAVPVPHAGPAPRPAPSPADSALLSPDAILDVYRSLREIPLDPGAAFAVDPVVLRREIAEFDLTAGTFIPFRPVLGRVTGGVFLGEGVLRVAPNDPIERDRILRLNDGATFEEPFEALYLRFTDGTDGQIRPAAAGGASSPESATPSGISETGPGSSPAADPRTGIDPDAEKFPRRTREDLRERFRWNVPARVAADLVSARPAGCFLALLAGTDGRRFGFEIDPHRLEPIRLFRYEEKSRPKRMAVESWCSTRGPGGGPAPEAGPPGLADAASYDLDIRLDKDQRLTGKAEIIFTPRVDGERMLPLHLAPTLRVDSLSIEGGGPCRFLQEDEKEDADLWAVFPAPLPEGVPVRMRIAWSGRKFVENAGGGNFSVSRRTSWYPHFGLLTDRADYRMKFAVPKGRTLIATGRLEREWTAGGFAYSRWSSQVPFGVVGFNYGKFEKKTEKSNETGLVVNAYSNRGLKDELMALRMRLEADPALRAATMLHPQDLTTKKMTHDAAIQGINACNVFTHEFGEIPFRRIKISQQPSGVFGQAWPTLVFLPYTALLSPSVRDRLGITRDEFYETVAAHEVAHQWFGHLVGAETYHDLWMEEGFAQYAAGLSVLWTEGEEAFLGFMANRRKGVLRDAGDGLRLTDTGPISLGRRLNTIEHPGRQRLVYDKGAYVLHMLRMMLYDYRAGNDDRFVEMMKDYLSSRPDGTATTADFRAVVERHFGRDMGWFFDQWVRGTAIPSYEWRHSVTPTPGGKVLLTIELTQSNVPAGFRVPFPFRIRFPNGFNVVTLDVTGASTVRRSFKLPAMPDAIEPSPLASVLCDEIEAVDDP